MRLCVSLTLPLTLFAGPSLSQGRGVISNPLLGERVASCASRVRGLAGEASVRAPHPPIHVVRGSLPLPRERGHLQPSPRGEGGEPGEGNPGKCFVIPAQAGIQNTAVWAPAFAGVTHLIDSGGLLGGDL